MLDVSNLSLGWNVGLFVLGAAAVWIAGTRISRYAAQISEHTGIARATLGLLLLGGVTSLPEGAVTLTAAHAGNNALAVNNLLGGVSMQVGILAMADFAIGRRALTAVTPDRRVILQGALNILLLATIAAGIIVGDYSVAGAGLWTWAIVLLFFFGIRLLSATDGGTDVAGAEELDRTTPSLFEVAAKTVAAGLAILVAGYLLSTTAEVIAEQSGLGSSFVGAIFLAISTSLPEVSTVLAAVRLGFYTMAISDILGTNLFDLTLIFLVDIVSAGDPVLNEMGRFSAFATMLGITMTALFVAGLAERRDFTVLRMGVDSLLVLVAYLGGVVILYSLR